jgi:hypothetical protein
LSFAAEFLQSRKIFMRFWSLVPSKEKVDAAPAPNKLASTIFVFQFSNKCFSFLQKSDYWFLAA